MGREWGKINPTSLSPKGKGAAGTKVQRAPGCSGHPGVGSESVSPTLSELANGGRGRGPGSRPHPVR